MEGYRLVVRQNVNKFADTELRRISHLTRSLQFLLHIGSQFVFDSLCCRNNLDGWGGVGWGGV